MPAADGKQRLTDAATAETLLRLVQSVPSPKAEPIKLWLAKVGYSPVMSIPSTRRQLMSIDCKNIDMTNRWADAITMRINTVLPNTPSP